MRTWAAVLILAAVGGWLFMITSVHELPALFGGSSCYFLGGFRLDAKCIDPSIVTAGWALIVLCFIGGLFALLQAASDGSRSASNAVEEPPPQAPLRTEPSVGFEQPPPRADVPGNSFDIGDMREERLPRRRTNPLVPALYAVLAFALLASGLVAIDFFRGPQSILFQPKLSIPKQSGVQSISQSPPTVVTTGAPPTPSAEADQTYGDPFAYCAAVRTADVPDSRYVGPEDVPAINRALKVDTYQGRPAVSWRCLAGRVMACMVTNAPEGCSTMPPPSITDSMRKFCAEQPNADFIPHYATGEQGVYPWQCANGKPRVGPQVVVSQTDERGFFIENWVIVSPR